MTDNLPATSITREEARRRTDEFKAHTEAWLEELAALHDDQVCCALGYANWDEYSKAEFESIRLPRGAGRTEAIQTLRQASLSIRDISSALGHGVGTIHREIEAGQSDGPQWIKGADEKYYPAPPQHVVLGMVVLHLLHLHDHDVVALLRRGHRGPDGAQVISTASTPAFGAVAAQLAEVVLDVARVIWRAPALNTSRASSSVASITRTAQTVDRLMAELAGNRRSVDSPCPHRAHNLPTVAWISSDQP